MTVARRVRLYISLPAVDHTSRIPTQADYVCIYLHIFISYEEKVTLCSCTSLSVMLVSTGDNF